MATKKPKRGVERRAPSAPPPASSPAAPAGHAREATKQETREALLRAGMEMFAAEGLDVPSLDALCARAGFTRGAFYVHFRDREDFIVAVMEAATGGFLEAILAARGEALDLDQIVTAFAGAVSGARGEGFPVFGAVPMHQVLAACARSTALRRRYTAMVKETVARLADAVRAGQAAGRVRADVDPEQASGLLVAIALGVGALREVGATFDMPTHARTMLALLARA